MRDILEISGFILAGALPLILGCGALFYIMQILAVAMGLN